MRRHSAHVDANVLAELNAGLINGRRATRIHAHLAGCQHCAQVSAGLTEVHALLAAVPRPPIPDAVARRLDAAIAAEAAGRSRVAGPGLPRAGQKAFPRAGSARGGSPRFRRRRLASPVAVRAFAAAAALCVVAGGSYALVQLTSPGQPDAGLPSASGGAVRQHGTFAGPLIAPTHSGNAARGSTGQPASGVVSSGIDYQRATLSTQVSTELSTVGSIGAKSVTAKPTLHAATPQQDACVQRITSGVQPALVDAARYQGHPATIIALDQQENQVAQAWVVGPRCSADVSDVLAHVWLPSGG